MNKFLIAIISALTLFLAGATYAAKEEGAMQGAKPAQQTTKHEAKAKAKPKARAKRNKCPAGEVYNKKEKKCVTKS